MGPLVWGQKIIRHGHPAESRASLSCIYPDHPCKRARFEALRLHGYEFCEQLRQGRRVVVKTCILLKFIMVDAT